MLKGLIFNKALKLIELTAFKQTPLFAANSIHNPLNFVKRFLLSFENIFTHVSFQKNSYLLKPLFSSKTQSEF